MKTSTTSSFVLKPFKNRNGVTTYRVSGWLHGERVRKNYKTRAEAAAEKSTLEIQSAQVASGLRPTATLLTPEQQSEAEAIFRQFKESEQAKKTGQSLSFYLNYALTNYRPPDCDMLLAVAAESYKTQRIADHAQGLISDTQLVTIKRHMTALTKYFPSALVSDLSAEKLKGYCARGKVGLKTHNNRRGVVSTFLKFAIDKDWIAENPIAKVTHFRIAHKRGTAPTLSAARAAELMAYVEGFEGGRLVPFFALCLFAGIRPCVRTGEILRLAPKSVNMETGVIHIEPDVSKVDMKRNVAIQPNLAAWLKAYPLEKYPIIVPNLQHLRKAIAQKFEFVHDIMRHTFISMHIAKFRSMGDTALQAGNSEDIIRKHYLDVISPAEAEAFFNIMPKLRVASVTEPATPSPNAAPVARQHEPMKYAA